MFALGASLEEARRRRGISLGEVEAATHIRPRYLRALEEERFEVLPGDAYVRGFLRTYAEFLGLDAALYLDEYKSRLAELPPRAVVPPPQAPRGALAGWFRRGPVLIGMAVVVLIAVLAWRYGGSPSPQPSQPPTANSLLSPPRPRPKSHKPARKRPAAIQPATLALEAVRGPCWVEVHLFSASGKPIYTGTLAQGGMLRFSLRRPLWLRLGDPTNLDATIAGKPVAGLPTQSANIVANRAGIRPA